MATELVNLQAKNLASWVAQLIDEVEALQSAVDALEEAQGGDDSSIPAIQSRLTAVENSLSTLSASVSTNTSNISTLQTTISTLQTTVSTLQTNLTNLTNRVATSVYLHYVTLACSGSYGTASLSAIIKNNSATAITTVNEANITLLQNASAKGTCYYSYQASEDTGFYIAQSVYFSDNSVNISMNVEDMVFATSECSLTDDVINLSL